MGLDQYLCKMTKKCNDYEELERVQELRRIEELHLKTFSLLLDGKKHEAINTFFIESYAEKYFNGDKEVVKDIDERLKTLHSLVLEYNAGLATGIDYSKIEHEEIGYWRKHSDLQGYMEDLYRDEGGTEEFNCVDLILSKENCEDVIDYSRQMIRKEAAGEEIEHTGGFFFGESGIEHWVDTLEIFDKVIKETDWDNETIYYSSWW